MTTETREGDPTPPAELEGRPVAAPRPAGRDWRRLGFRVAVVLAVAPIFVSAVRNGLRHWLPAGDAGVTTIRVVDVLSRHPPLIGMQSSASSWFGHQISFIGAFQLYLLALPVRLLGLTWGVLLGMAVVNASAIVASAWLVRRRTGYLGGTIACAFLASLLWTAGSQVIVDITPMQIGVIPFALLLIAAWSVADGDAPALLVLAIVGNYLVIDHLTFAASVPLVGLTALVMWALHLRRVHRTDPEAFPVVRRQHLRWLAAGAACSVVLWLPPLYQQVAYRDGNLGLLVQASSAPKPRTPTVLQAASAVVATFAVPPLWLPPSYDRPTFDPHGGGTPFLVALGCGLVLLAVYLALLRSARRRHDHTAVTGLLMGVAAVVAMFITTKNDPNPWGLPLLASYLRAMWPAAMFVWLVLVLAALRSLPALRRWSQSTGAMAAALGLTAILAGLALPTADHHSGTPLATVPMANALRPRLVGALRGKGPVLITSQGGTLAGSLWATVMLELQAAHIDFKVDAPADIQQFGHARAFTTDPPNARSVVLVSNTPVVRPGYHLVAVVVPEPHGAPAGFDRLDAEVRAWAATVTSLPGDPTLAAAARQRVGALTTVVVRQAAASGVSLADDPTFIAMLHPPAGAAATALPFRTPGIDPRKLQAWAATVAPGSRHAVFVYTAPIGAYVRTTAPATARR